MTHEKNVMHIESVEHDIEQIFQLIHEKEFAKKHSARIWDEEIKTLHEYLKESQELLVTLKNNR